MITRRELLAGIPLSAFAQKNSRPKIAAVTTVYHKFAHTQHIVDRFLEGYGWNGQHHHPPMDLVSLYVNQVGADDLSRERAARFPTMKIYPTIAEALTLGGSNLAVDGVVLVGEHGKYPYNEKHQHLYPRYEFFQQIVKVFESSGRSVPVFNDKHLWQAPASPSPGAHHRWKCRTAPMFAKQCASATAASTAMTSTRWRLCNAWWSAAKAVSPA